MYCYIPRISIKKIGELIDRTDKRTIRKWCKKNHLIIFKDSSGEFVYKNDFDIAYDNPLILKLKEKYQSSWYDYYQAYNKDELLKMLDFGTDAKNVKSDYVPKGKFAARINRKSA